MKDFKFNLGDEVQDIFTGFKGIIRSRADYLTGCNRYGVQNQTLDKEGKLREWEWFDEDTLKINKKKKIKLEITAELEPIKKRKVGGVITKDHIPSNSF